MHRRWFIGALGAAGGIGLPARARTDDPASFEDFAAEIALGGGEPPLRLGLKDVMTAYGVPALSVAMITDNRILWAKAFGVAEAGTAKAADARTLFQAGAISKTATAVAAMTLAAEGRLSLEGDVNAALKAWHVPDNDFTRTQKVTLRRIMSHTAGLSVHGFPGYEVGAALPTLPQILDGLPPANTPPVRVIAVPGTQEIYSGGGVTIEQLLMTEATGQAFPDILHERALGPFGMGDSTYHQPLPDDLAPRAASGTRLAGPVPGKWHVYPEMAAAGLWTTPSDLANFAIGVARARRGEASPIGQALAAQMLTRQLAGGGFGLGFQLFPDDETFGHGGVDDGFHSSMLMDWRTGKGIVFMTNGDGGSAMMRPLLDRLRVVYGLSGPAGRPGPTIDMLMLVRLRGVDAALAAFDRLYAEGAKNLGPVDLDFAGNALAEIGDTADALRLFRRNAEAYPKFGFVQASLARACTQAGQKDLAVAAWRKVLEINPNNDNAKQQLKALGG